MGGGRGGRRDGRGAGREEGGEGGGPTSIETPWSSCRHLPCQGDVHGAMAAVSAHGSPTGALQRRHSLNRDITGSAKSPPEKQTS